MIYIDFPGGAHGHFLEFILLKHVMRLPEYENFTPFTKLGTSHKKLNIINKPVQALHITQHNIKLKPKENDLVIKIPVYSDMYIDFLYYGNLLTRVADGNVDLTHLEKNTIEKLSHNKYTIFRQTILNEFGIRKDYSRAQLRNILYSQIRQRGRSFVTFTRLNCKETNFDFAVFYNWDDFLTEINRITKITGNYNVDAGRLLEDYNLFLKNNAVLAMKDNTLSLFNAICSGHSDLFDLNILEEAFLNALITDKFNIHSDLRTFDDYYIPDSGAIATEIKQILRKRNETFSLDLSISQQLDKVVLEF